MHGAQDLLDRVKEIGDLSWQWETQAEADLVLKEMRLIQKQVWLIKRDINSDMTEIRRAYKQRYDAAQADGAVKVAGFLLGRKSLAKRSRAETRRRIQAERNAALKPYEMLKQLVDDLRVELDEAKLRVEQWKHENSEADGE